MLNGTDRVAVQADTPFGKQRCGRNCPLKAAGQPGDQFFRQLPQLRRRIGNARRHTIRAERGRNESNSQNISGTVTHSDMNNMTENRRTSMKSTIL
jgi:hypothetical protein